MTRICLKTNYGKKIWVDVRRVPNVGEDIILTEIPELYDERGGQSPLWKVKNVTTVIEALTAVDESQEIHNTGIIVEIVNEDE